MILKKVFDICFIVWKVELGSRAGALKQMLLDILEDPHEIRRICIMGRNCTLKKGTNDMECSLPQEKQIAEGKSFIGLFFCAHGDLYFS